MESGSALGRVWPQAKGSDPTPLLSPGMATSQVLCPVLGSSVQEGQEAPGEGSAEATRGCSAP